MTRNIKITIGTAVLIICLLLVYFVTKPTKTETHTAAPGEIVALSFELDKKLEFGEYYFDLDNGSGSTYPLCYCLTEKNMYPPDCHGDIQYIYSNIPGTMCVPLHIGLGRCSVTPISSSGHATAFMIPLEYAWTKPFEKIVMGIRVPSQAPEGARLVIAVTIFKQVERSKLVISRTYEKRIMVKRAGN